MWHTLGSEFLDNVFSRWQDQDLIEKMWVPSLNTLGFSLIFVPFRTKCSVSIRESFLKILRGQGYMQAFVQVDAQVTNENTLDFGCSSSYETPNSKIIQPIIMAFAR